MPMKVCVKKLFLTLFFLVYLPASIILFLCIKYSSWIPVIGVVYSVFIATLLSVYREKLSRRTEWMLLTLGLAIIFWILAMEIGLIKV